MFLVDIKHIDDDIHQELTGLKSNNPKKFIQYLNEHQKKMWIRHVLVNGYTNNEKYLMQTREFLNTLDNVEKVEVLPYHTLGIRKYEKLGIEYPLKNIEVPSAEDIKRANEILRR